MVLLVVDTQKAITNSKLYQFDLLEARIKGEVSGNPNRRIVTMLEKMKLSLNDNELGCIDKSQFKNNKYMFFLFFL